MHLSLSSFTSLIMQAHVKTHKPNIHYAESSHGDLSLVLSFLPLHGTCMCKTETNGVCSTLFIVIKSEDILQYINTT